MSDEPEQRVMRLTRLPLPGPSYDLHYTRQVDQRGLPQFTCECGFKGTWGIFHQHAARIHTPEAQPVACRSWRRLFKK